MRAALTEMLGSKKFITALLASVAAAGARLGFDVDTAAIGVIIAPLLAYIAGQAHVDHAKEVVKAAA